MGLYFVHGLEINDGLGFMANLLQCLTTEQAAKPYHFKATGVNVYSLEEMLYYCYHHWRRCADDLVCEELIIWVRDVLELSSIAARLREIATIKGFAERLLAFLTVTPYFIEEKIATISYIELLVFEGRNDEAWLEIAQIEAETPCRASEMAYFKAEINLQLGRLEAALEELDLCKMPNDLSVKMKRAQIRRRQGRMAEYKAILADVLNSLKVRYKR